MSYEASIKQKMDADSIFSSARRAGLQQGRQEGLQEGRQEGSQEAKIVIVRNLIQKTDMSDEQIAELAVVSLDVVKQIRAEGATPEM